MFEPWIRAFDSAAGACVASCVEYLEGARAMMDRGAREGEQIAGVPGAIVGGAIGWAYGGYVGAMAGMAHGSVVGAKEYAASKDNTVRIVTPPDIHVG